MYPMIPPQIFTQSSCARFAQLRMIRPGLLFPDLKRILPIIPPTPDAAFFVFFRAMFALFTQSVRRTVPPVRTMPVMPPTFSNSF